MKGADLLSSSEFGGAENLDVLITAGGTHRLPGTYLWQNHRLQYAQAGQWGYLRVLPIGDTRLIPLHQEGTGRRTAGAEEAPGDETASGDGSATIGPVSMVED